MIFEFRLKIRFDLNPNFRLNEKRSQISDSGMLAILRGSIYWIDRSKGASVKWLLALGLISRGAFAHLGRMR